MNVYGAQQLRDKFLEFFVSKGHKVIPSAPLVPQDDPSVLFTTAGMHPLVPYLLGQEHPAGKRVVNVQKCIRTTDIDEVGDSQHLTFFEMLGNWSFGDYFKEEAIAWAFEFLTGKDWLDIDPYSLYISVFAGDSQVPRDTEAIDSWKQTFRSHPRKHIQAEFSDDIYKVGDDYPDNRIFAYGRDKNWWQAGDKGPAGPDTEIFFDTEASLPAEMKVRHKKSGMVSPCHINCDCGRFVEIWNNVFMQYNGIGQGKYEQLKQKNVDTGMGLERILAVLHGDNSVFDTELFSKAFEVIISEIGEISNEQEKKSRIIVDHLRAATFLVADGVVPSNKERGYVLRRIFRRALVHGKLLGLKGDWMEKIVSGYIKNYSRAYSELARNSRDILNVLLEEQKKFGKTLEQGLKEFRKFEKVTGKDAFNFFQSFGIPWEITAELSNLRGETLDRDEFEAEFKRHQELSRASASGVFKGGLAGHSQIEIRYHTVTHLLQAALRKVLGSNVFQKGSNITPQRTRFDFTYPEKMTPEQIKEVEEYVNEMVKMDLKVIKDMMTPKQARDLGAIGLFGEKYAEKVCVYTIVDDSGTVYSREFCGGPHVEHTAQIGKFKIAKEEAVSAGTRRIKGVLEDN